MTSFPALVSSICCFGPRHGVTVRPTCDLATLVGVALVAIVVSGCNPTYAPPIRSSHPGAAGRHQPGEWVVGGSSSLYLSGGPQVSIPVGETPVHIEVGGEFMAFDDEWALGYAGGRVTYDTRNDEDPYAGEYAEPAVKPELGFAVDGEFGLGAGVGGERDSDTVAADAQPAPKHPFAYGGYAGFGVAGHFASWFAMWARARLQVSKATRIPTTLWYSAMAGPEFKAGPVLITPSGGFWAYQNDLDDAAGFNGELGLSLVFD